MSRPTHIVGVDLSGPGSPQHTAVLYPGSVMAPSAPRMVYLTLRGVGLTRMLMRERPAAAVVEVHPTAALALHGAPAETVRAMKASLAARRELLA